MPPQKKLSTKESIKTKKIQKLEYQKKKGKIESQKTEANKRYSPIKFTKKKYYVYKNRVLNEREK